jgi:hypothetical protein
MEAFGCIEATRREAGWAARALEGPGPSLPIGEGRREASIHLWDRTWSRRAMGWIAHEPIRVLVSYVQRAPRRYRGHHNGS